MATLINAGKFARNRNIFKIIYETVCTWKCREKRSAGHSYSPSSAVGFPLNLVCNFQLPQFFLDQLAELHCQFLLQQSGRLEHDLISELNCTGIWHYTFKKKPPLSYPDIVRFWDLCWLTRYGGILQAVLYRANSSRPAKKKILSLYHGTKKNLLYLKKYKRTLKISIIIHEDHTDVYFYVLTLQW